MKLAAKFRLIHLTVAVAVYLPVWHWHCTRARFTVLVLYEIVRSRPILCVQSQVAKLASELFYCWSSLRSNNTAINLQTFTWSYSSRRFSASDQDSPYGFSFTQMCFFSRPGCLGLITKNRIKLFSFSSDQFISNFSMFNNIKITLYYTVFMRTSGEKLRVSDEAEPVV